MEENFNVDDIIIDDELFSIEEQNKLESIFLDLNFPWYYQNGFTVSEDDDVDVHVRSIDRDVFEYSQFCHQVIKYDQVQSSLIDEMLGIYNKVSEKYKFSKDIIRIKSNLCTKIFCDNINAHQTPHIDYPIDHMVMIYYVNDSDGDTFVFDQRVENLDNIKKLNKLTVKKRISPKKGRVLIFDGRFLHSGMHPREHNHRIIINFNFLK
jgi:hypothetical protein